MCHSAAVALFTSFLMVGVARSAWADTNSSAGVAPKAERSSTYPSLSTFDEDTVFGMWPVTEKSTLKAGDMWAFTPPRVDVGDRAVPEQESPKERSKPVDLKDLMPKPQRDTLPKVPKPEPSPLPYPGDTPPIRTFYTTNPSIINEEGAWPLTRPDSPDPTSTPAPDPLGPTFHLL